MPNKYEMIVPETSEIQQVRAAAKVTTLEILDEGDTPATVLGVVQNAHTWCSTLIEAMPHAWKRDCKLGCFWCCWIPVTSSPVEALAIASHLAETWSPDALDALKAQLTERVKRRRGWTLDQRVEERRWCIFLRDGQCAIYEQRPLGCRGYCTFSQEDCQRAYEGQVEEISTGDGQALAVANGIKWGLRDAVRKRQLEDDSLELESAVLRALTTPQALERWRRGKRVFRGCDPL
jgi:Fe-S-cluster containining protein